MNAAFLLLLAMLAGSLIPAVRILTESSAAACLLYYGVLGYRGALRCGGVCGSMRCPARLCFWHFAF